MDSPLVGALVAAIPTTGDPPIKYVCKCGATGVRLYREYSTFLNHITLRCTSCALKHQKMEKPDSKHSIGWLVAAVPTDDQTTFWGYTSVPEAGVLWWNELPL